MSSASSVSLACPNDTSISSESKLSCSICDILLQRLRTFISDLFDALRDSVDDLVTKWDARLLLALRRAGDIGLREKEQKSFI